MAAEYGALKEGLAQQFPENVDGYMDGKDAFMKATEREALRWYRAGAAQHPIYPRAQKMDPRVKPRG